MQAPVPLEKQDDPLGALPYLLDEPIFGHDGPAIDPCLEQGEGASHPLRQGLLKLLKACAATRIDLPLRAQGQLRACLDMLGQAAEGFRRDDGARLSDAFWTAPHYFWNGTVARALTQQRNLHKRFANIGYIALFCRTVSPRALFWSNASPLTVRDGIEGTFAAGGPYLVLLECRQDAFDDIVITSGYAQSILDYNCFMPVSIAAERALLKTLLALQDRLDDFGWEVAITRENAGAQLSPCLNVRAVAPDNRVVRFSATWGSAQHCDGLLHNEGNPVFHVEERDLASGQFVQRLASLFEA